MHRLATLASGFVLALSSSLAQESASFEALGDLPGGPTNSWAIAVSANGSVVSGFSSSQNGFQEAIRWEDGVMEGLGDFPGGHFRSWAYDVSADGSVVVGYGRFGTGEDDTEAFRWEAGADTLAGLGDLPGGIVSSVAWAVSPDGSVVVGQSSSENGFEAFRWTEDGGMEGLGDLSGGFFFSYAQAVSADGSLVGGYGFTTTSAVEAFLWTEDDGIRNLKDVLESDYGLDLNGWTLISVRDISDDGTVLVGEGVNTRGDSEGWRVILGKSVADDITPESVANVLSAPSPNPVRGSASLTLRVSEAQHVVVGVYDVLGRHLRTLFEGALLAGGCEVLTLDASTLPAGVHFIRATGADFTATRRITTIH